MLSDKIEHYNKYQERLNNTPAQYKSEFVWLKEVDSLALANAQLNLQSAYNNFFRNKKLGFRNTNLKNAISIAIQQTMCMGIFLFRMEK
jgi:transposase